MGRRDGARRSPVASARALLAVFAVVLLVPVLALGAALDHVYQDGSRERTLDDARASARLLAQTSVRPAIAGQDLDQGLDIGGLADLGASVDAAARDGRVVGLRLVSPDGRVVFPPQEVGRYPHDPELDQLAADPRGEAPASLTTATLPEWLGGEQVRAVSVHAPVFAPSDGRVLGVLHVLLPYEGVAAQVQQQSRAFGAVLLVGLAALYAVVAALALVVTRRLRLQLAETDHQAHHDPLTGLPNRSLFRRRAEAAIGDGDREVVVAIVDLDRFKLVNDTLGHEAGDELLRVVSQRLLEAVRTDDTVARLGGDEFGLVLPGLSVDGAQEVLRRVHEALHAPCRLGGGLMPVAGSVGLASAPAHGASVEALLRHADAEMYRAKRAGQEPVAGARGAAGDGAAGNGAAGDGAASSGAARHPAREVELLQALAADQLVLHYRPVLGPAGGGPSRVEALVRWAHPSRGLLDPGDLLPSHTGQVEALTWWVLRRALADLADHPSPGGVAVDLPAAALRDPTLPDRVVELLEATATRPGALTLQVTGWASGAPPTVRAALGRLRDAGVQLSTDDIGRGGTPLHDVGSLPFTEVRVDVARLADGAVQRTVVAALVAVARAAGMRVVAEGVASAEALSLMRALGCDGAQGPHLGVAGPLPASSSHPERRPATAGARP